MVEYSPHTVYTFSATLYATIAFSRGERVAPRFYFKPPPLPDNFVSAVSRFYFGSVNLHKRLPNTAFQAG